MIKSFSKSKRIANHVVWTGKEVMPVAFYRDGTLENDTEVGMLKVVGRDVFCHGYRVDLKIPIHKQENSLKIQMFVPAQRPGDFDVAVPGTDLTMEGVHYFGEKSFSPNIPLPKGSYWKMKAIVAPGQDHKVGAGITITYFISYANGPLTNRMAAFTLNAEGIGFWALGDDFVVT